MELLLNLAWLLLALPAYWLWCCSRNAPGRFRPCRSLLALGCMLVVLFPVVSATDDLRAMRAELEESPSSKRNCHASSERISAGNSLSAPALTLDTNFFVATEWSWYHLPPSSISATATTVLSSPGRAPPTSPIAWSSRFAVPFPEATAIQIL